MVSQIKSKQKKHTSGPEPHVPHAGGDITKEPLEDVGSPKSEDFSCRRFHGTFLNLRCLKQEKTWKVRVRVAWPGAGGQKCLRFWWRITTIPFPCSCFLLVAFTWAREGHRKHREFTSKASESLLHCSTELVPTIFTGAPTYAVIPIFRTSGLSSSRKWRDTGYVW